jgi:hypothetical protein
VRTKASRTDSTDEKREKREGKERMKDDKIDDGFDNSCLRDVRKNAQKNEIRRNHSVRLFLKS